MKEIIFFTELIAGLIIVVPVCAIIGWNIGKLTYWIAEKLKLL